MNGKIAFCSYSQIPICNLPEESFLYSIDVFFSRMLKASNCVSWYSNTGMPDLGGAIEDDFRRFIPTDYIASTVSNPGFYTAYCIEIEVGLMALNAILASEELKNIDKEISELVDSKEDSLLLDDTSSAKFAFKQFKLMVNGWLEDVVSHQNDIADKHIQNIHRWLASEISKLHDPVLLEMLNKLMRKIFCYLIAKIKSLGGEIVYADFNRIIVGSGKQGVDSAISFINFILKTIISFPIFSYLTLNIKNKWKLLLFNDIHNYVGIPDSLEKIDVSMNICSFLPPKISRFFTGIVAEYMMEVKKSKEKFMVDCDYNVIEISKNLMGHISSSSKEYVKKKFANKMYNLVPEMIRTYNLQKGERREKDSYEEELAELDSDDEEAGKNEWDSPEILGSCLQQENAVLTFLVFLFQILGLDSNISDEIEVVKKNCFKFLQISSFSKTSEFKDPCLKLELRNIVCQYCFAVLDFDVFRYSHFIEKKFSCAFCEEEFNSNYIESKIVEFLKKSLVLHQIQDLYCKSCGSVKKDYFSKICDCSGKYDFQYNEVANSLILNFYPMLKNLKKLAKKCDFKILNVFSLLFRIL